MSDDMMPPSTYLHASPLFEPDEVAVEETVLNTWIEDTGVYLQLDSDEPAWIEEPPAD